MNTDLFKEFRAATGEKRRRLLELLVKENEPLVRKFVDRYVRGSRIRVPYEDVYQAGLIGLCKALEKLDLGKGKLSTYAAHWIKNEVQRETRKSTDIYRPERTGVPYKVVKCQERYLSATGRYPNAEELSEMTGEEITADDVESWRQEAPVYDRWAVAKDEIAADTSMQPETLLSEATMPIRLQGAIKSLTSKERKVVTLLAEGLNSRECCKKLGLSQKDFRTLRNKAQDKMREALKGEG